MRISPLIILAFISLLVGITIGYYSPVINQQTHIEYRR